MAKIKLFIAVFIIAVSLQAHAQNSKLSIKMLSVDHMPPSNGDMILINDVIPIIKSDIIYDFSHWSMRDDSPNFVEMQKSFYENVAKFCQNSNFIFFVAINSEMQSPSRFYEKAKSVGVSRDILSCIQFADITAYEGLRRTGAYVYNNPKQKILPIGLIALGKNWEDVAGQTTEIEINRNQFVDGVIIDFTIDPISNYYLANNPAIPGGNSAYISDFIKYPHELNADIIILSGHSENADWHMTKTKKGKIHYPGYFGIISQIRTIENLLTQ